MEQLLYLSNAALLFFRLDKNDFGVIADERQLARLHLLLLADRTAEIDLVHMVEDVVIVSRIPEYGKIVFRREGQIIPVARHAQLFVFW